MECLGNVSYAVFFCHHKHIHNALGISFVNSDQIQAWSRAIASQSMEHAPKGLKLVQLYCCGFEYQPPQQRVVGKINPSRAICEAKIDVSARIGMQPFKNLMNTYH